MRPADPERIYTPKPDPTPTFGLFAPVVEAPRPVPSLAMRGGSESGMARIAPKVTGVRAKVLAIYAAIGPCTRNAAAAVLCGTDPPTPEAMNTTQGRSAELLKAGLLRVVSYERNTGRGLLAVTPPTTEEG